MEGQEPSSWGSIKLSCPWSGVLCGHWTSLGSKSLVCSSTKDLPLPPSAGGVAPEHSYPQIPGWPPLPSGSPCRDMAQNLPFSCIRFTHPWVFGNDGPRGTPILPLDIPAAEAQRVPHPSTWVTSEWQIQRTPPSLLGFQPHGHPPVLTGHWSSRGAEKDEKEAVHLFPTLPRVGRQEGHTTSPTTSTLLGLQWWYWELQGGKGAPEKPPRALTFSVSS